MLDMLDALSDVCALPSQGIPGARTCCLPVKYLGGF